jgi:hypothetical protein
MFLDKALGGLILNPSVTKKNFLSILGILIVTSGPYRVTLRSTGHDLTPLQPGQYDIRPYSRKGNVLRKSLYVAAAEFEQTQYVSQMSHV